MANGNLLWVPRCYNTTMAHPNSGEYLKRLDRAVGPVIEAWRMWQALFIDVGDDLEMHSIAVEFFLLVRRVFADHIMLSLARLNDREQVCGHDTFVMSRAVRDLNLPPGSSDHTSVTTLLSHFETLADTLLTDHRHNRLAHNNYGVITSGTWTTLRTPTVAEIGDTVDALAALTQRLAEVACGGSVALNVTLPEGSQAAGQIQPVLESAITWRRLREQERSMTDAELRRAVRRGVVDSSED